MIGKNELAEITRLFGFPCDLPEVEATMHSQVIGWCEKKCGKSTAEQCWQKYFEIIRRNNNGKDS